MKKVWIFIIVMVFVLSACRAGDQEVSEPTTEETSTVVVDETPIEEEAGSETSPDETPEEVPSVTEEEFDIEKAKVDEILIQELKSMAGNKNLADMWQYIEENISKVNVVTADAMLISFMTLAEEQSWTIGDDLLFGGDFELHQLIYDTTAANQGMFDRSYLILGDDKDELLQLLPQNYSRSLAVIFDSGFGLINAEGSYYPTVDYQMILGVANGHVSEMTEAYLKIMNDNTVNQTTVEEYLAITPAELGERAVELEGFLMTYSERPEVYTEMITRLLNVTIYKLSAPNPFDGAVTEEGILSNEYTIMYQQILDEQKTPVITMVADSISRWVESRAGYVGTYSDMDALYTKANELFDEASNLVTDQYMQQ